MTTIELLTLLMIIAFTWVGTVALVVFAVVLVLFYRKLSPTLDSARETTKRAQEVTTTLSERVIKPLLERSAFAYNVGQIIAFLFGLSRKKGGKKDG